MLVERVSGWVWRRIRGIWIPLILVILIVSTIGHSLNQASWVEQDSRLVDILTLGVVLGWAVAQSRYRGGFVLAYVVSMALLASIQITASVAPPLGDFFRKPFDQVVEGMNLRGFLFRLRVQDWLDILQSGGNVEDTGLFVLVMSLLLVLVGAWWMWATFRRHQALAGLLPVGLLFAIHLHLSRQSLMTYGLFLVCAVLMIAYCTYQRQEREWQHRQVDYPEQLGLEWGASAFALALVVVMIARFAPLVGTPEGWRAVSEWVNRTRQQTSNTAERLFSGVNPPPPPAVGEPEVRVNTPNLGEIGSPIDQGPQVIMWVTISDPPPPPPEMGPNVNIPIPPARIHYWRSSIYSTYTGRGWQTAPPAAGVLPPAPLPTASPDDGAPTPTPLPAETGRYVLRQEYEVEALHDGMLFSVNNPVQASGVDLRQVGDPATNRVEGPQTTYQVLSQATNVTANQLADAPMTYPDDITVQYLQLPENLPGRVRALSERLAGDAPDAYQKALIIQNYLRETFPYDLAAKPAPENRDVVDYFLFTQQKGFCSHYASAMVVMLRAVGVPARVATGYAMGEYDRQRAAYRVTVSLAHAWVEVYFPGYGWIEFEPTAYRPAFVYPEEAEPVEGGPVVLEPAEPPVQNRTAWTAVLTVAAGLLLLALPFLLLRAFRAGRQPPETQVNRLYRQMRWTLALAGLAAPASFTPDEYLHQYGTQLNRYPQLTGALRQVTQLYRETNYSPRSPDLQRVRIARQYWQQSWLEWLLLWVRDRWQKFKS